MAYYRMYRHHLFDTYKGVFLMENKKLLEEIRSYWNNRADGYSRVNQEELHSEQKEKWKEVLLEQLPKKEKDQVQILDIGTGPGFFAILLAEEGYQVTAVDYKRNPMRRIWRIRLVLREWMLRI